MAERTPVPLPHSLTIPRSGRSQAATGRFRPVKGRLLHLVTDALPTTSAGYAIRTHEIAVAQR
ncbi:MAG: glycosyltransferase WbuB, partial [Streptosporangiaceae bacterium]